MTIPMTFVPIPIGEFLFNQTYKVRLTRPFSMMTTMVTNAMWADYDMPPCPEFMREYLGGSDQPTYWAIYEETWTRKRGQAQQAHTEQGEQRQIVDMHPIFRIEGRLAMGDQ